MDSVLNKIKAVSFDLGGTLITASAGEVYSAVAKKFGTNLDSQDVQSSFVRTFASHTAKRPVETSDEAERKWWYEVVTETLSDFEKISNFDDYFDELMKAFSKTGSFSVYSDVLPCLKALEKANIRRVILSNWDSRVHEIIDGLELRPYFEDVLVSSEIGYSKPNPRIFEFLLDRLGLMANEVLHVGDDLTADVMGAHEAGLEALLIWREKNPPGSDVKSITSLIQIPELIS